MGWLVPADVRASLIDDLDEAYRAMLAAKNHSRARRWYWRQVLTGIGAAIQLRTGGHRPPAGDERPRHVRGLATSTIWQDVRYGLRTLRRSPAFAAVAVLVLALGIGINTAVFSIVNAVLFRTLQVPALEQLVYVYDTSGVADINLFRERFGAALGAVAAHASVRDVFSADGRDERLAGELVTANYFDVVGVRPMLGRTFRPADEDLASTELAVVISDDLWSRRFARDPAVVGKHVRIHDKVFTVAGIVGPTFTGLAEPWNPSRFWITTAQFYGATNPDVARAVARHPGNMVARLVPGISFAEARAILSALRVDTPRGPQPNAYLVLRASDVLVPSNPTEKAWPIRLPAYVISVIVALVLLIAAANLAGILMARGVTRTSELAVRRALGAGTLRLVRQLLTESVLLSAIGGLAGLFVAELCITLYRAYSPAQYLVDVPLDTHVLLFTAAVCIGTGLLVGLAPALQALKVDVIAALGGGVSAGAARRVSRRLRHGIVIPQIALSIVLLVVAGAHVRTLMHLELSDLGYRTEHLAVLRVGFWVNDGYWNSTTAEQRAARTQTFFRSVLDRIREVPGVSAAGFATWLPVYSDAGVIPRVYASQDAFRAGSPGTIAEGAGAVSDGYYRAMGISLLRGRDFDSRDTATSPRVAIISESLARRLWPAGDSLGRMLGQVNASNLKPNQEPEWSAVIGIVSDVAPVLNDGSEHASVYGSMSQVEIPAGIDLTTVIWATGDQTTLEPALQTAIGTADASARVSSAQTMTQMVAQMMYPRRATVWILGVSGFAGLLLAAIGLYGVISYSVAQRLREIGIRSALGAGHGDIVALVLKEGAKVAAMAAVPGLGLSVVALRLTSRLVGPEGPVPATDLAMFVVVPLLMAVVILLACYIPARRAARVDPMVVLRGL
jgi:putative ABC transport system permease protein